MKLLKRVKVFLHSLRQPAPVSLKLLVAHLHGTEGTIIGPLNSVTADADTLYFSAAAAVHPNGRPATPITSIHLQRNSISHLRVITVPSIFNRSGRVGATEPVSAIQAIEALP